MDLIVSILSKYGLQALALVLVMAGVYEAFHKSNSQTAAGWESEMATNIDGFFQGGLTAKTLVDSTILSQSKPRWYPKACSTVMEAQSKVHGPTPT